MKKQLFFFIVLPCLISLKLNAQNDTTVSDLIGKYTQENLFDTTYRVFYSKTESIEGYMIDYRYYVSGNFNSCVNLYFFIPKTDSVYSDIVHLLKNEVVGVFDDIVDAYDAPYDIMIKKDTLQLKRYKYEFTRLKKKLYEINDRTYSKLSDKEYVKIFKVKALVDIYKGNNISLRRYNQICYSNKKHVFQNDTIVHYQVRYLINYSTCRTSDLFKKKYPEIPLTKYCSYRDSY